jgi:hypothetical protein
MPDESADPVVPVVCADCGTETEVPLADAVDAIERHNDQLHDGEQGARVDPAIAEHVTDLVAQDLGLLDEE